VPRVLNELVRAEDHSGDADAAVRNRAHEHRQAVSLTRYERADLEPVELRLHTGRRLGTPQRRTGACL